MGCGVSKAPSGPSDGIGMNRRADLNGDKHHKATDAEQVAACKIEAIVRGHSDRASLQTKHRSATLVQSRVRGKAARRRAAAVAIELEVRETTDAALKRSKSDSKVVSVNEYTMQRQLGKGAYGQVYKATRGGCNSEDVAIKVLSRSILKRKRIGRHGSAYDSVMGEIAVMKQVSHPNIVRLLEVIDDPDEDLLFMVIELVSGGDLSVPVMKKRIVPEDELRTWLRGLTLGLEHLHLCGVCHRDIKPENILWDPQSHDVKLSDFGISGFFQSTTLLGGDYFTSTGGSYPFFAPEMCRTLRGAGYSGRAADVWACGVSLYMWLYHRPPYVADHVPGLLQVIANDEVEYPTDEAHSPSLLALLGGMLERKPKMRLRLRDIRRDEFITSGGAEPLPPATAASVVTVRQHELRNCLKRMVLLQRAGLSEEVAPAEAPMADAGSESPADEAATGT